MPGSLSMLMEYEVVRFFEMMKQTLKGDAPYIDISSGKIRVLSTSGTSKCFINSTKTMCRVGWISFGERLVARRDSVYFCIAVVLQEELVQCNGLRQ